MTAKNRPIVCWRRSDVIFVVIAMAPCAMVMHGAVWAAAVERGCHGDQVSPDVVELATEDVAVSWLANNSVSFGYTWIAPGLDICLLTRKVQYCNNIEMRCDCFLV